jgi:ubiquitin-conjugating enzyme E2 G1
LVNNEIISDLCKNTDAGFSVGLVDDNDFYKWSICFTGPEDTIYEVSIINSGRIFQSYPYFSK